MLADLHGEELLGVLHGEGEVVGEEVEQGGGQVTNRPVLRTEMNHSPHFSTRGTRVAGVFRACIHGCLCVVGIAGSP